MRRVVAIALAVVAMAVLAMLWPARLGGHLVYVATYGSSMEPGLSEGDLAAVRESSTYRVGDVVAYRSRLLDTVVLHRIVDVREGRYTLKGDNNRWLDREQPTSDDLIGKLSLHIPAVGRLVGWAHLGIPPVAALLLLGGGTGLRRRHRRRPRTPMHVPVRPTTSPLAWRTAAITLAISAAAFGAMGMYAAATPTTEPVRTEVPYAQRAAFSYTADAPPGPVYDDGRAETGEPIYLRVVNAIDVSASYDFDAAASSRLHGTLSLRAEIRDGTGWQHTVELAPPMRFHGLHAVRTGRLDLARVQALLGEFRAATGAPTSSYTVSIVADTAIVGTIDGYRIDEEFSPQLDFHLDALRLTPDLSGSESGRGTAMTPSATGTIGVISRGPRRLEIAGLGQPVSAIRAVGPAGATISTLGVFLSLRAMRRRLPCEASRIAMRHGKRILRVNATRRDAQLVVVDVASFENLVRLADHEGKVILHQQADDQDTYTFQADRALYQYTTAAHLSGANSAAK